MAAQPPNAAFAPNVVGGLPPPPIGGGAPPPPPLAAAAAAPLLGQQQVAHPYRDWYNDHARDPFVGNYDAMYANYALARSPLEIRNSLYPSGNSGIPIAHLLLTVQPNDPVHAPGVIQGYHRLTRYQPSLVSASPFDNVAYAFLGDVQGGQAPHTVVWAETQFHQATAMQVPTADGLDQLLATDPNTELVGPFAAGDPDTEQLTVRFAAFIPNRYMVILLNDHLTPRQAWQRIRGAIVTDGLAQECEPLIDWLQCAITRRPATAQDPVLNSVLAQAAPAPQGIGTLTAANSFRTYRMSIVEQDFPDLRAGPVAQGAQIIAGSLNELVSQNRLAREADEQRRQKETNKTPQDLFPANLQKLFRYCQAQTTDQLPEVYTSLARAKKGNRRMTIQAAINVAMQVLGYDRDFPITTKTANRVLELEWTHQMTDDLSLGLQVFTLGWLPAGETENVKRANSIADAMSSGAAAPSVADAAAIIDSGTEVRIPRSLAQLRYSVEHLHAFWYVHLGPTHPMTGRLQEYHRVLIAKEGELELVVPRNNLPKQWLAALLARRLQIDCQVWMSDQSRTDHPLEVPRLVDVFSEIARRRDWAPDLPDAYFAVAVPSTIEETQSRAGMSGLTDPTEASTRSSGSDLRTAGTDPPPNQAVHNNAPEAIYDEFALLNHKTQKVRDYCVANNIPWPRVRRGTQFCASYHIKHMCNTRCRAAADHRPHTPAEAARMAEWCHENYKVIQQE